MSSRIGVYPRVRAGGIADPTVFRLIDVLAAAGPKALTASHAARAEVRTRVRELADGDSPAAVGSVIVDIDGMPVLAHSEKQDATAIYAGSNSASGHITTARLTLAQLPEPLRRGRRTLIRTDSAGGTHAFLDRPSKPGRWLSDSVGMTITDMPDSNTQPNGIRLIVRKERPRLGVQLGFTGVGGLRLTCFATNDNRALSPPRPRKDLTTNTEVPAGKLTGTHERSRSRPAISHRVPSPAPTRRRTRRVGPGPGLPAWSSPG